MILQIFFALFLLYYFICICFNIGVLVSNGEFHEPNEDDILFISITILFSFILIPVMIGSIFGDISQEDE